jgi:hypothetical protein
MTRKFLRSSFTLFQILGLLLSMLSYAQPRGAKIDSAPIPAGPGRRLALVIGNMAYQSISPLKNPVNDARDMTTALKKLGFEVSKVEDADLQKTNKAIRDFVDNLREKLPGAHRCPYLLS